MGVRVRVPPSAPAKLLENHVFSRSFFFLLIECEAKGLFSVAVAGHYGFAAPVTDITKDSGGRIGQGFVAAGERNAVGKPFGPL